MDTLSRERRSWNMSRIRSKNTAPEKVVRSYLHRHGFRFRLHSGNLPGKPDILLPKYKTVIFVHGCFWHRHEGCKYAYRPKTRKSFWKKKFYDNVRRFTQVKSNLEEIGWKVLVIWECQINNTSLKEVISLLKKRH